MLNNWVKFLAENAENNYEPLQESVVMYRFFGLTAMVFGLFFMIAPVLAGAYIFMFENLGLQAWMVAFGLLSASMLMGYAFFRDGFAQWHSEQLPEWQAGFLLELDRNDDGDLLFEEPASRMEGRTAI